MKDQVLSIQQMLILKELEIDISKASMLWVYKVESGYYRLFINKEDKENLSSDKIPTFTLQDMIELMPSKVKYEGKSYYLSIDKRFIGYIDCMDVEDCVLESDSNILENTYKVLVWLAEHKYI